MIQNTVQTLIDYVKDISGQTNASTAKIIRALNFGTDHLSVIKLMKGSKSNPDSANHTDVSRVTVTTSDTQLQIADDMLSLRFLEILESDGVTYTRLIPADERDAEYTYLQSQTGKPTHYDIFGQTIRLFPVPDSSNSYRLSYGRVHPRYSADNLTQTTGLLPNEEEYVALYAADRIMIGMSDSARAGVRNELTIKQGEVEQMVASRDQATPKRLKPKSSTLTRNTFRTR
jgi:hypothetical protein